MDNKIENNKYVQRMIDYKREQWKRFLADMQKSSIALKELAETLKEKM